MTEGFKSWYSGLSEGEAAAVSIGGKVITGAGAALAGKWLLGKIGSAFAGGAGAAGAGAAGAGAAGAGAAGAGAAGSTSLGLATASTFGQVAAILGIAYTTSSLGGWSLTANGRAEQGSGNMDAAIVRLAGNGYSFQDYIDAIAELDKQLADGTITSNEYRKAVEDVKETMFNGEGHGTYQDAGTYYFMNEAYGDDWTKEEYYNEMLGRDAARDTMMEVYTSDEGRKILENSILKQLEEEGKITEEFLTSMLTITQNGYTYTGSQHDLDAILLRMYPYSYTPLDGTAKSGRFNDSAITDWFEESYPNSDIEPHYIGKDSGTVPGTSEWWNAASGEIYGNGSKDSTAYKKEDTSSSKSSNNPTSFYYKSHALGLDYVPYDNYPANLHYGEAVLTASQAKKWREQSSINNINNSISVPRSSKSSYSGTTILEIKLSGAVDGMTYENQHAITQAVIQQLRLSNGSVLENLGNSFVRIPN